ncbi:MAG: CPBP family intramembrane metalloprotease, partial [Firmicutes bacterium]|nr:CPBP family intramembrane metalloprotease [Candidatus Caballimonas caccae]
LGLINEYVSSFFEKIGLNILDTNIEINNTKEYICFVLSLAILPAIFEETFFRGFMLSSLKKVSPFKSIIFVSLCFSLYHGNVSQLIYQFIFGFFLCALTIFSKSIIPSIIAHFLNNFIILSIIYFKWDIAYLNYNITLIVIGLIVLVSLFVLFMIKTKKEIKGKQFEGVLDSYIFALIGFILTILLIVLNLVGL